jgi:translation initiation factor 1
MTNSRLVYSTDDGDKREASRQRKAPPSAGPPLPRDGVVRVFREKGGRGGKTVTVVRGLEGNLDAVAKDLKRQCGAGGAVKAGTIEIQGDHRDKVVAWLRAAGYAAKSAGG